MFNIPRKPLRNDSQTYSSPTYAPLEPSTEYRLEPLGKGQFQSPEVTTDEIKHDVQPDYLGRWNFGRYIAFAIDVILAFVSVLFIILAAFGVWLDGKHTNNALSNFTEELILLSPTIFPIIFAAIVGKFFRALGLWRVEHGIRLGTLERLIGGQSLFAAIERQIALQSADVVGFAIIMFWALSPVGGQSALRLLGKEPRLTLSNTTVRYLPIEAAVDTYMSGGAAAIQGWPSYAPLYMTALRTPTEQQNSTQDLWGNVRIPSLATTIMIDSDLGSTWKNVSYDQTVTYTSLLGLPVAGLPTNGNSSFQISTRYWALNCSDLQYVENFTQMSNTTAERFKSSSFVMQLEITPSGDFDDPASIFPFNLTSLVYYEQTKNVSIAKCQMSAQDVDAIVVCMDNSCSVSAMRPSPLPDSERPILNFVSVANSFLEFSTATIGLVMQSQVNQGIGSTSTEMWLADNNTDFTQIFSYVNLSQVPADIFSKRMEMVYNTFWQSTYGAQYLTGNLTTDLSEYDNVTLSAGMGASGISFNSTLASLVQEDGQQYVCNTAFAALLFLISILLLIAAVATIVLKHLTLAPDILGYVSSHTRHNEYCGVNPASRLTGLERARTIEKVVVRIGDVKGESEVGHIAFATGHGAIRPLRRNKLYD